MKKLFIIFLIIPFISISNPISNFGFNDVDNFKELNAGICYFGDDYIFPGFSFLWGRSIYYSNNTALEFQGGLCLLYTSPSPRDNLPSRMPSSA